MLPAILRSSSAAAARHVLRRPRRRDVLLGRGRPVGGAAGGTVRGLSGGGSPDVAVQLDYYMSLQFAGVACALVNDVYRSKGLDDLRFLPTCPVGHEAARVRAFQDAHPATLATFGTVEQNVLIPALRATPTLRVTAVAAMMRRSPLCVASLGGPLEEGGVVGAHEDTVDLLRRLLPRQTVEAGPRGTKCADLLAGKYDGVQAYATTEVPALRRRLAETAGREPGELTVRGLEGLATGGDGPARLGYSQVLFVADEALGDPGRREAAAAFLRGTFEGWQAALRDPDMAIAAVAEAQKMLGLDDEENDHWHASAGFDREMLRLVSDQVKETFSGDRLGVVHQERWTAATEWLLRDGGGTEDAGPLLGLDRTGLWQPSSDLLHGNELGRTILEEAQDSALRFAAAHGKKPSLAVVTVGDLKRYEHAERRLQLYSNPSNSWFTKTETGEANGFAVTEVRLDAKATTDDLLSEIYRLRDEVDGIQVMWPLPPDIDAARVYNAVPLAKDVDGIHYAAWGSKYPPVTPAGALALAREHGVRLAGRAVLVVGRSPIVGAPLAHLLREAGAMVTVAHAGIDRGALADATGRADVVFACAGEPGALDAAWLKEGAEVLCVGTTFRAEEDALVPDVAGDVGGRAGRHSPVPGGVGPLSAPMLFRNVARAAWDQAEEGEASASWGEEPATLRKSFHFDTYTDALDFMRKVDEWSTIMDHHANMSIVHKCVDGVDLTLSFSSFQAKELTEKDRRAANAVDLLRGGDIGAIAMSDFGYDLQEGTVALFPAEPRGSSRLLRVDSRGQVSHHGHFGATVPSLLEGCHVVFNNSRVLDARLSVELGNGVRVELMLLDLGSIDPALPSSDHVIQAMIRSNSVLKGDIYVEPVSGSNVEVVDIRGIWEEEEESGGNGCDCLVRIHSHKDIGSFLRSNGSVPIPPYLNREAVPSDRERYNNVYAKDGGSVAAPTAGLHFTDEVLRELGETNTSSLTLHVGAGTFMPVLSQDARDHSMHAEHFFVNVGELRTIVKALEKGKPLLVVGTTSSRTLESLFWLGLKRLRGLPDSSNVKELKLGQFEWIPLSVADPGITPVSALNALIQGMSDQEVISGQTSLMITPDCYKFKVIEHLLTNFHAPDSTLMLLVSAFLGKQSSVPEIYEDAQRKGYKFLSYGDACIFSRPGIDLPVDYSSISNKSD